MKIESQFVSIDHFRLLSYSILGIALHITLTGSNLPDLAYIVPGLLALYLILSHRRVIVAKQGIMLTYVLRPIMRRRTIPLSRVKRLQWKFGNYTQPRYTKVEYYTNTGQGSKVKALRFLTPDSTDWVLIKSIIKNANSSIETNP